MAKKHFQPNRRFYTVNMVAEHNEIDLYFCATAPGPVIDLVDRIKATARAKYPQLNSTRFRIVDIY